MMFFNYFLENTDRLLTLTLQHFIIFIISTLLAFVIGIMIAVYVTSEGRKRIGNIILNVTAAAQSVPSIAVISLIFIFVGIGLTPSIIALVIYSIVPIVFNAVSGLLSIEPRMIEAAEGIGLTRWQILWKVKMPVALPVIFAGLRSAATINIGTATIASIIGGGGLGDLIFEGLKLAKNHVLFIGAILTALMAIIVDFILANVEKAVTSPGLHIKR